jgi:threonylcarbamoyladenosine tRNA methylthiotransferase MtaB
MKTVKFYTLGCKVNQYETQSIRERFLSAGFKELKGIKSADFYLINTCTVTQKADRESLNFIRRAKRENPFSKVIVTGCLAEKKSGPLAKNSAADLIISKRFFPDAVSGFLGHTRAFLKIQDGCDNFCSYCKVPLVRGSSRSRAIDEVISEAKCLARKGFKEIVLTGICLGAYADLSGLIKRLEDIDGLLRIRLSSIEAGDVSDALIKIMARSKKICRHLHIPIQSGSGQILKKMRRKYSASDYLKLIRKIKQRIPDIAITTDCIVGFPGESESHFRQTLDLVRKIRPLKVHIFPYSQRPGTLAGNLKGEVDAQAIKQRMLRLKRLSLGLALEYKQKFINRTMDVLIEGKAKNASGFWQGYTDNYIKVKIKSRQNLKNKLVSCILTQRQLVFP